MTQKVIFPENLIGEDLEQLQRLMGILPPKDRSDAKLKRFLVFRLRIDGEETTRNYLLKGLSRYRETAFKGSLYEYLSDGGGGAEDGFKNTVPDERG